MPTVYIDSVFLINVILNCIITAAAAKICGADIRKIRVLFSGIVGGIYAVLAVLWSRSFITTVPMKIISGIIMILIAFGNRKDLFRAGVVFFCVSAFFAGAIFSLSYFAGEVPGYGVYIPYTFKTLVISFGICYAVLYAFLRRAAKKNESGTVAVRVELNGKSAAFTAARDTGNTLRDPLTGMPVIVAGLDAVRTLVEKYAAEIEKTGAHDPTAFLSETEGEGKRIFRIVPYSAVGVERGMLLAVKPDRVWIDDRRTVDVLIAISPTGIGSGECVAISGVN